MAKKKTNGSITDAPDANASLTVEDLEALEEQLGTDGDGAAEDGESDDDGGTHDVEGDAADFEADLAELEAENAAALDKADPPAPRSDTTTKLTPRVDPAVERERLIGMLLPEVKAAWGHLDLKSVGRQTIDVTLTKDERIETATGIADCRRRLAALDARESRLKAAIKAARAAIETEQSELYDLWDRGTREQPLHVATFLDFKENRAVTVRQDTAAIVSERALTVEERQLLLVPRPVESETPAGTSVGG